MKTMQEMWPEIDIRDVELQQALLEEKFSISATLGNYIYNSEYSGQEYQVVGATDDHFICKISAPGEKAKEVKIKREWVGTVVEKKVKEYYEEDEEGYVSKRYVDEMYDIIKKSSFKEKYIDKFFENILDEMKEEQYRKTKMKNSFVNENETIFENKKNAFEYMKEMERIMKNDTFYF